MIQKEEVSEIKWVSLEKLKELFYSDKWVPYDIKYKDKIVEEFSKIFNK